jgi:hypothetical protein
MLNASRLRYPHAAFLSFSYHTALRTYSIFLTTGDDNDTPTLLPTHAPSLPRTMHERSHRPSLPRACNIHSIKLTAERRRCRIALDINNLRPIVVLNTPKSYLITSLSHFGIRFLLLSDPSRARDFECLQQDPPMKLAFDSVSYPVSTFPSFRCSKVMHTSSDPRPPPT